MDKLLKYLVFFLIAVALASCGGDDKDEPDNPNEFEDYKVHVHSVPLGSYYAIIGNTGYGDGIFLKTDGTQLNVESTGWNPRIAYVGLVSSLDTISLTNNLGWASTAKLVDNGGYVIEGTWNGVAIYIRLIVSTNTNASGEVIGVTIKHQQFKVK